MSRKIFGGVARHHKTTLGLVCGEVPFGADQVPGLRAGRVTDPEFDPRQRAFCCARVVEIPTSRWTVYDALKLNVEMGPEVEVIHQERVVSSPIWYAPSLRGPAHEEPV